MIQRAMAGLMGLKNILVLNDEAHHCYREKPGDSGGIELKGDEKEEAKKNNEAGPAVDFRSGNREAEARH